MDDQNSRLSESSEETFLGTRMLDNLTTVIGDVDDEFDDRLDRTWVLQNNFGLVSYVKRNLETALQRIQICKMITDISLLGFFKMHKVEIDI